MASKLYEMLKRLFDISAAAIGIIGTSPVWLLATLGILISDPGKIFYRACRVGKDNQPFSMLKFRSMRQGVANESVFRGEENRIFKFGKFMRDTKIDELPQLLCCLQGTMSIIGPRPAAKDQLALTRGEKYAIVSTVKPGLSGPAALYDYIYGDTVTDENDYATKVLPTRMALEVYYVEHRSIMYDLKMIWWTIVCIGYSLLHKKPQKMLQQLQDLAA